MSAATRQCKIPNKSALLDLTSCPKEGDYYKMACIKRTCADCSIDGLDTHLADLQTAAKDASVKWKSKACID